ncbi:hypothetical protein C8F04DRAFT_894859, partial [Mycena alexandri]
DPKVGPVGSHAIMEVWEDSLALKIHDSLDVQWTSADVVRIGTLKDLVLWIDVVPESLSGDKGVVVASKCREILFQYVITDVDV